MTQSEVTVASQPPIPATSGSEATRQSIHIVKEDSVPPPEP